MWASNLLKGYANLFCTGYIHFISATNFFISDTKSMQREKKFWISRKEIHRFFLLVLWCTRNDLWRSDFMELQKRILSLWDNSGSNFLFKYLKEVLRITVRKIAGLPVDPSQTTFVKVDKYGYPTIIPINLCQAIRETGDKDNYRWEIIGLLTCLSVFRVLPTKVEPSFGTVTDPFNGISRVLDPELIAKALSSLKIEKISQERGLNILGSVKAGPNSKRAFLGTALDAIALVLEPKVLLNFLLFNFTCGRNFLSLWCFCIAVLSFPYYIISRIVGAKAPVNGRLSIVYDQAGKARVVALTNWWLQMTLYPIHKAIFAVLKTLPQDGTFNQLAPLNLLCKTLEPGQKLSGFDLSAATDRLPIDLQVQILNQLMINGDAWRGMLGLNWFYKQDVYRYAVGQPMGAYSSWAMLALTHHVIVKIASLNAGLTDFKAYCILGDDVVIGNDRVAGEYLKLMETLGVKISLGKSIISAEFTEFAKKLIGPNINLSPIGPGLILRTIRYRYFIVSLIFELLSLNLITESSIFARVSSLPAYYRRYEGVLTLSLFFSKLNAKILGNGFYADASNFDIYSYWDVLFGLVLPLQVELAAKLTSDIIKLKDSIKHTILEGLWISQSRLGLPSITEALVLPVMPGIYFMLGSYIAAFNRFTRDWARLYLITQKLSKFKDVMVNIQDILPLLESSNIASLDWSNKVLVKEALGVMSRLSVSMRKNTYQLRIRNDLFISKKLHFIVVRPKADVASILEEHKNFFKVFPIAGNGDYKRYANSSRVLNSIKRYEDISRLPKRSDTETMLSNRRKVTTKPK